jgi:5-formyltetrahydrofolate cyclo-ligase
VETPIDAKRDLRRQMRAIRKALPDQAERSERIWARVQTLPAVDDAGVVMVFTSVLGEPITQPFIDWCEAQGKRVVAPEDDPTPDPTIVDVVIVPGTAFTILGGRLGQGGGWYDRFLGRVSDRCVTIGVCFDPQVVDDLPTEPHDVSLDIVVTDVHEYFAAR